MYSTCMYVCMHACMYYESYLALVISYLFGAVFREFREYLCQRSNLHVYNFFPYIVILFLSVCIYIFCAYTHMYVWCFLGVFIKFIRHKCDYRLVYTHAHPPSIAGLDPYLATFQKISDIVDAGEWLFFTHGNSSRYLLLLSTATSGTSKLYLWKGTFVHVQDLSTNGASAADAYTTSDGRTLVAIANGGSDGNRVVNSNVYEVRNSQLVQVCMYV